jgi:hypothetical protein
MTHLDALNLRLSNERQRLALAKSTLEREQRTVWVSQCEKEVASERSFLGLPPESQAGDLDADALLAELLA